MNASCKKCGGKMKEGKAIEQTFVGTYINMMLQEHLQENTVSPGGSGKLVDCMKCEQCGWSVELRS